MILTFHTYRDVSHPDSGHALISLPEDRSNSTMVSAKGVQRRVFNLKIYSPGRWLREIGWLQRTLTGYVAASRMMLAIGA